MQTTHKPLTAAVREEWRSFRSRGRIIGLAAAVLVTVLVGLLVAFTNRSVCSAGNIDVACPTDPLGPDGQAVSDRFSFAHRPLGSDGSITVRMTSMTGIITYPPPDHDEIVPGLVPWAKAGIMIKNGLDQGSSYAAIMLTGGNGVRMQHDYVHDIAGRPGGVSPQAPRWLRLTRSGDTITGYESADGANWAQLGTAQLAGLPETVQVGLFATSPGDLTLKPSGASEVRFTQASGSFDNVSLTGAPDAGWRADQVGEMGTTDWERYHQAPGLVESNGTFKITGSGDVGPLGSVGGHPVEDTLAGLVIGLIIVVVVATRGPRASSRRSLAAKAVVIGAAAFVTGLVMAGVAVPVGSATFRATGSYVLPTSTFTELLLIVGVAGLVAVTAVFALTLRGLVKRGWVAIIVTIAVVVVPYVLAALPLLPDAVSGWLLRLTPAAGFAVQQTIEEFPQVVAHYAVSAGYFPLPGWAGLAVLCGYTAALLALATGPKARGCSQPERSGSPSLPGFDSRHDGARPQQEPVR